MAETPQRFFEKIREAKEKKLKKLHLSNVWSTDDKEKLTEIPAEVFELEWLEVLNLSVNRITTLPEAIARLQQLQSLHLSGNQITTLPEAIASLPQLTILDLDNNPIETPPEIVAKGIKAIRDYFQQLETEGTDYLSEAKLLIVGEGGAGKTTLAKKIESQNYQLQEEDSTKGIKIIRWSFMENGREFRVNIWDFGGQEIYHATHQFFLTKRSLYALVADNQLKVLSQSRQLLLIEKDDHICSLENMLTTALQQPQFHTQGTTIMSQDNPIHISAGRDISGVINLGKIGGDVTNTIQQLPECKDSHHNVERVIFWFTRCRHLGRSSK